VIRAGGSIPSACRRAEWIMVSWVIHSVNRVCGCDAATLNSPDLTNAKTPSGTITAIAMNPPTSRCRSFSVRTSSPTQQPQNRLARVTSPADQPATLKNIR
jgi:hypothetical protein